MITQLLVLTAVIITSLSPTGDRHRIRCEPGRILTSVAGGVLKDATFLFVDAKTGKEYASPSRVPEGTRVKLQSGYNDWRYWNGVLLIAMMQVSDVLNDSAYALFSRRDIAFCFDN